MGRFVRLERTGVLFGKYQEKVIMDRITSTKGRVFDNLEFLG